MRATSGKLLEQDQDVPTPRSPSNSASSMPDGPRGGMHNKNGGRDELNRSICAGLLSTLSSVEQEQRESNGARAKIKSTKARTLPCNNHQAQCTDQNFTNTLYTISDYSLQREYQPEGGVSRRGCSLSSPKRLATAAAQTNPCSPAPLGSINNRAKHVKINTLTRADGHINDAINDVPQKLRAKGSPHGLQYRI